MHVSILLLSNIPRLSPISLFRDCFLRLEYSMEMRILVRGMQGRRCGMSNADVTLAFMWRCIDWAQSHHQPRGNVFFYCLTHQKGGQRWDPQLLWCKCSFVWKIFHLRCPSAWLPSRRKIFYEGIALEHDLDVIENHNSLNAITFLKWRIQVRA